jgi:hypothetical protein
MAAKWAKKIRAQSGIKNWDPTAKGKGDTDNLQVHILLPSESEHEIFHLMKADKTTQRLQFIADWYNL